jgi:hypothetical protein
MLAIDQGILDTGKSTFAPYPFILQFGFSTSILECLQRNLTDELVPKFV